nr:hypothetical protein [Klebsiella variicola]
MTKSTITREQLEEWVAQFEEDGGCDATDRQLEALIRQSLAAMESDPVAWTWQHLKQWHVTNDEERARDLAWDGVKVEPLYRRAQPVPSSEPITVTDDMAYAFHHALTDSMIGADDVEEIKTGLRAVFANLTAPVVSAEYPDRLPCSVLLEPGLRFGKGIKTRLVLDAIQRRAEHYAELEAMTPEERAEYDAGIEAFKAMLPQPAPQSPGSDHATVPGKWIPASEQKPDCWCLTCRPVVLNDMRFVVCPDCGNKRCPRANDHRNACTGSNEPGQEGSAYPAAPQEVPDGK